MLKELIRWWAARMLECLPQRLRHLDRVPSSALIVSVPDAQAPLTASISQIRRGRESFTGRVIVCERPPSAQQAIVGTKHRVVRLRLPATCLLERTLLLPRAAHRDIARVLEYEIDRFTPFRASEIFWQFVVEPPNRTSDRLKVKLSLVPKAPWRTLLRALAEAGITVTTIEVPRSGQSPCRIDLDSAMPRQKTWARRGLATLVGLYVGAAAASILLPFALQALALHAVDRQIATLRPEVEKAEALRQKIANSTAGIDVMALDHARTGDVLTVLATVTDALPDDTYITSFSFGQGHLLLSGRSGVATKLIPALSENRVIRNAAFDAPTTRIDQATVDWFSIRADLVPLDSIPGSVATEAREGAGFGR